MKRFDLLPVFQYGNATGRMKMAYQHQTPFYSISGEEYLLYATYRYFHISSQIRSEGNLFTFKILFNHTRQFGVEFRFDFQEMTYCGEWHARRSAGFFYKIVGAAPLDGSLSQNGKRVCAMTMCDVGEQPLFTFLNATGKTLVEGWRGNPRLTVSPVVVKSDNSFEAILENVESRANAAPKKPWGHSIKDNFVGSFRIARFPQLEQNAWIPLVVCMVVIKLLVIDSYYMRWD